ncbi:aryl-phospho-beta-glucosidase [Coriobacterium glomerans PW2]|uniref:Aryl-phospho-beta-glucosidase n=1 Tax=Coriobacterium glomerans (strain ATCC 49209 / DSM 20642 / JCM 10262 / PW2) TaxID=700015 RepID=F2N7U0_CORGP|nr:glycoside hydrolase family 1 protein [Coriobacterium glomerans]AEB07049.1 aryl-phospho-beta-glucosidase [Coriobacterium glomerans PW2]
MIKKAHLPQQFFFGAALSGPQTEGAWKQYGKLESVWDRWSQDDIDCFHNKVGSYVGNDMINRCEEDYQIFRSLGLTTARTSIQWTRLVDQNGALNRAGADLYHRMIATAKREGIDLFINLYHFDMPAYLLDRGGWENREVVEAFANYARLAFREFGHEVHCWFTFNEPIVEPENSYTKGLNIPFIRDFRRACAVQYHIALAHSLAAREFRLAKAAGLLQNDAKLGLVNNFAPPYTKSSPTDADLDAVRMVDGLHNRWWLDLVTRGSLPCDILDTLGKRGISLPIRPGDEELLSFGTVDWLGFNYYEPMRVQAPDNSIDDEGNPVFAKPYVWSKRKMNESRGWEIYPKGIYDFGMKIKRDYPGLEFFVSENGMGVENEDLFRDDEGLVQDDYRIAFIREHLFWIARAIDEGANCVGYHYWAVIDNWSWTNAFKNRYGIIGVDLAHNYERYEKKSAAWMRKLTATHVVE